MYLVLTQDVDKLGKKNEVVKVKPGFGRNFLLPNGLAVFCTETRLKQIQRELAEQKKRQAEMETNAKQVAQKLKDLKLTIKKKVTSKGTLYGGVKEKDIADLVKKETAVKLDPETIELEEPIKTVGDYRIIVNLTEDTKAYFKLKVQEEK